MRNSGGDPKDFFIEPDLVVGKMYDFSNDSNFPDSCTYKGEFRFKTKSNNYVVEDIYGNVNSYAYIRLIPKTIFESLEDVIEDLDKCGCDDHVFFDKIVPIISNVRKIKESLEKFK